MNRPIRVAQIIGRAGEGGVESMIMNLYRNIDHSQVVFDFFVESTSIIIKKEEIESYGGKVIIIPSYKHISKFKKTLKNEFLSGNYDIVHSNMNALSFISLKIAKKCGIKVRIAHSHSTTNKKEKLHHIIKSVLRPYSKKYATHYFACSEKAGRWLFGNKAFDSGCVYLINNAIDLNKFVFSESIRNKMRSKYGVESKFVIGHIGRFCKQKNQQFLVNIYKDIIKKDDQYALLLIGNGESKINIESNVKNNDIQNVIFVDSAKNIQDYYQMMDCFVLPSLYEGLPVVGVEAQANGLKCFFSSNITKEVRFSDETEFLSLEDGYRFWANKIFAWSKINTRRISAELPKDFNIRNSSIRLLNLYNTFLSELKND